MVLNHLRSGYQEPSNMTSLGKCVLCHSYSTVELTLGPPDIPPTPGPFQWVNQALKTIWQGTPRPDRREGNQKEKKEAVDKNVSESSKPRKNLFNEHFRADPIVQSTPKSSLKRTSSVPPTSNDTELDDDMLNHILQTSTPMPRAGGSLKDRKSAMEALFFPSQEPNEQKSNDTLTSPSKKTVAFNPQVNSIIFKDPTDSSTSSAFFSGTTDNSVVEIDQQQFEASSHKHDDNEHDFEDIEDHTNLNNSTVNHTVSGLHKTFPGKFPKSAMVYPEEQSFAATTLTDNQVSSLSRITALISKLFTANMTDKTDDKELDVLVENLDETLKLLKDDKQQINRETNDIEKEWILKIEQLAANYRYTTSLLAENIKDIIDDEKLKRDLSEINAVLKDQEKIMKKANAQSTNVDEELIEKLKSQIKESTKTRARKILELPNSTGTMKSRVKRTRERVCRELEKPGLTLDVLSALKQFESCDRTATSELHRSFIEMDSATREQPSTISEPHADIGHGLLRVKDDQIDRLTEENNRLNSKLKIMENDKNDSRRIIDELRSKVLRLESELRELGPGHKSLSANSWEFDDDMKENRPSSNGIARKSSDTVVKPIQPVRPTRPLQIQRSSSNIVPDWRMEADMDTDMI